MSIPKKIKIISAILSLLGLSLGNSLADGPAGVTDAALWLDAAQLTGLTDGQTVSTWTDMSGNGNSPTAAGSAATYKANVVNGQPVVRFSADGNAYFSFTRISTIRTVFWVVKNTNPGEHFMLGDSASYDFHAGNPALWNGTWAHANIQNGKTRLMGSVINGTATTLSSSSFSLVTLITTGNVVANQLSLDRGIGGRSWAGDMAEVIIYTRELSTAEELAVNTYLANKYGLSLVVDQPLPGDIYWDNNGSTAGFGTAAGTWAAPTTGNSSQGWSGDPTGGTLPVDFTTAVTNNLRFGSADAGLAAGTVTVSGGVTASNLTFAGSSGGITLTGGTITLADTTTIAVDNGGDTISSVLAGAANSLTKQGAGTLQISGRSTVAGDITVGQGVLINTLGGLNFVTGDVFVSDASSLYVSSGWGTWPDAFFMANAITLSGTGTGGFGALHGQANFTCTGPITLLTDSKISHDWNNFSLNGAITGTDKNLILSAENGWSQPGLWVNGSMSLGSGAITVIGWGFVNLNAANSFRGGTTVSKGNDGALVLYNINALGTGGLTVNSGVVDLNYQSISIPSLSGTGGRITDTGAAGTTMLTVTQSVDTTFSGVISDGASRVISFTKAGSGTLTLAGRNTYSGATTINAGGLVVVTGGSSVNGPVAVADGAFNGVQVAAFGGQWACSNLTYSTGTTTLDINFGSAMPSTTIAPLRVAGDLDMGTVGISVRNGLWSTTPGTYPLISYSGTLSGTVPASALSLPVGVTATLVNNTGSKRIDLNVTVVTWAPSSYNTWTNLVSGNASGTWGTAANWSNNIPNAVDAMVDFSTLDITADSYVNNDTPRTVGQLRFGDTTASHSWVLTDAALTLATTVVQPVIDVRDNTAAIVSVLQGTQGFVKKGSGWLTLYGNNTVSGDIYVDQGVLSSESVGLRNTSGSVIVSAGAALAVRVGWDQGMSNPIFLSGTGNGGYGALHGENNFVCSGPITLLTDSKITHNWNWFALSGPITGADKNLELAITVGGQYPMYVNSVNLGTGMLTIDSVQDGGSGDGCAVALNAANTYSGGTVLKNYAILRLGNANALGSGGVTLNPNSQVNLNTFNVSIAWLSGPGGRITDWNGGAGTTTLTVNQATDTTYSGVIANGASRTVALVKTGSGTLTLAGTNTYTGATAISNGTLAVSGALTASPVTVCTGAAFAAGSTGVVGRAELGSTLTFENGSALLVDLAPPAADAVEVTGDVTIGTGVEVRLSGSQEKSGSWDLIKTTGTVLGSDPVLINGLNGAKLTRTDKAIVLTIPPMGTLLRLL